MSSLRRESLIAVGALALIALGIAAVFWARGARELSSAVAPELDELERPNDPPPTPVEADSFVPDELAGAAGFRLDSPTGSSEGERTSVTDRDDCRIVGVLVDELDRPLEGVRVVLFANDGELRREATSGLGGEFELLTPLPDASTCLIRFSRGEQQFVSRRIPMLSRRDALKPGDNDLGRIAMRAAGRVEGRVVLRDGTPVPYIPVAVFDGTFSPNNRVAICDAATTGLDGMFRVDSVPAGVHHVRAGNMMNGATTPEFHVSAGDVVRVADIELLDASFIAGEVVDERGAPRSRVSVTARSSDGDHEYDSESTTDAQGRFVVLLDRAVPHELVASWTDHPVDPDTVDGPIYTSTCKDVRLVLASPSKATFFVVDAKTGKPVEQFGLRLAAARDRGPTAVANIEPRRVPVLPEPVDDGRFRGAETSRANVVTHRAGKCELLVYPDSYGYQINAPGYAPAEDWLTPEARNGGTQTIRLARGPTITGRLLRAGQPATGATVRLRGAENGDASPFEAAGVSQAVGKDGTFRFDSLAAGTYLLEARSSRGGRKSVENLRVVAGATLDLGDVALSMGANLRGGVLLPRGAHADDLVLRATGARETRYAQCDAEGRFDLRHIPAGRWTVEIPATFGVVVAGPTFGFDLAAGEDREVVLDVTDRAGSWLAVRVVVNREPSASTRVEISTLDEPDAPTWLGSTNRDGVLRRWCAPLGRSAIDVLSGRGLPLAHVEEDLGRAIREDREIVINAEAATLVVDWSAIADGETFRPIQLRATSKSSSGRARLVELRSSVSGDLEAGDAEGRGFTDSIGVGEHELTLWIARVEDSAAFASSKFRKTIDCRARETTQCRFTGADKISTVDDDAPDEVKVRFDDR